MRINVIINRYLLLELLPPFGVNLFFFTFIFLVTKILDITNMVVNYQVSIFSFLLLLLYSLPFFLAFITPMSVMMAILLTFLRMSADNEIVALKACGMNPHRFMVPVFTFCLMGWLLTTGIAAYGLPLANRAYHQLSLDLARTHAQAVIKDRAFIDIFDGLMLYVNKVNLQDRTMTDVFIEDQRSEGMNNIIVAPKGVMIPEIEKENIRLRLFNGTINQVNLADQSAHAIDFKTYEMNLDLKKFLSKRPRKRYRIGKMTIPELYRYARSTEKGSKEHHKALMKLHEKFSLPVACFVLGLVAMPLGMQAQRGRRSKGTVIGIILFLCYYFLLSVGWSFGESGTLPPAVGMWAPNIIVGAAGIYLYRRMIQERAVQWQGFFNALRFKRWCKSKDRDCAP